MKPNTQTPPPRIFPLPPRERAGVRATYLNLQRGFEGERVSLTLPSPEGRGEGRASRDRRSLRKKDFWASSFNTNTDAMRRGREEPYPAPKVSSRPSRTHPTQLLFPSTVRDPKNAPNRREQRQSSSSLRTVRGSGREWWGCGGGERNCLGPYAVSLASPALHFVFALKKPGQWPRRFSDADSRNCPDNRHLAKKCRADTPTLIRTREEGASA
jgi:hypothetical protein